MTGVMYMVYAAIQYMRKNPKGEKGAIVCTSSQAGLYKKLQSAQYTASKYGVIGLVRALGLPLLQVLASSHMFLTMRLIPV